MVQGVQVPTEQVNLGEQLYMLTDINSHMTSGELTWINQIILWTGDIPVASAAGVAISEWNPGGGKDKPGLVALKQE